MSIASLSKQYTFADGTYALADEVNTNFDDLVNKVNEIIQGMNNAMGTKLTLDARLDIALNEDGTLKAGVTEGSEWVANALACTYVSGTSFTVPGDQTDIFLVTRRVKAVLAAATIYGAVDSSSYDGGTDKTTVVCTWDSGNLTDPITQVDQSFLRPTADGGAYSMEMAGHDIQAESEAFAAAKTDEVLRQRFIL